MAMPAVLCFVLLYFSAHIKAQEPQMPGTHLPAISSETNRPVVFQNGRFLSADFGPGIHAGFAVHDLNGKVLFDDAVLIPGAGRVQLFSIAAAPKGGVAVSGMAWEASGRGLPFVAMYSEGISLERVVRMVDFMPRAIVYSADGRLFAFGPERGPEGKWLNSGHCLRVLNAEGSEVGRGLPRTIICSAADCFPFGDVAIAAAGRRSVALYIPEVNRIFLLSTATGEVKMIDGLEVWKRRQPKGMVAIRDDAFAMQHFESGGEGKVGALSVVEAGKGIERLSRFNNAFHLLRGGDGDRLLLYRSPEKDYVWLSDLQ